MVLRRKKKNTPTYSQKEIESKWVRSLHHPQTLRASGIRILLLTVFLRLIPETTVFRGPAGVVRPGQASAHMTFVICVSVNLSRSVRDR